MADDNQGENQGHNKEMKVRLPDGVRPMFSNSVQVNVTNREVVLNFVFLDPQGGSGEVVSRIALTPQHAIDFKNTLDDTVKRHFTKHLFDENNQGTNTDEKRNS